MTETVRNRNNTGGFIYTFLPIIIAAIIIFIVGGVFYYQQTKKSTEKQQPLSINNEPQSQGQNQTDIFVSKDSQKTPPKANTSQSITGQPAAQSVGQINTGQSGITQMPSECIGRKSTDLDLPSSCKNWFSMTGSTLSSGSTEIPKGQPSIDGTWTVESGIRSSYVTSASTVVLPDGTFRTYVHGIRFFNSSDGISFGETNFAKDVSTGYSMIGYAYPAILSLRGKYILIMQKTKEYYKFFRAVSDDGINFTVTPGKEADGAVFVGQGESDDVSVPDLIAVNDSSIRLYFVKGPSVNNNKIESAISYDEGLTWKREGEITINGLPQGYPFVDPDIIRLNDGRFRLFFATNGPGYESLKGLFNTRIRSAYSTDGRNFTLEDGERVGVENSSQSRVDPDVVKLSNGKYRMYFSETKDMDSQYDLRSALSP